MSITEFGGRGPESKTCETNIDASIPFYPPSIQVCLGRGPVRRTRGQKKSERTRRLTSPNAPLPITLTVLKSRKPIFVRRSLRNCDCVRVCLLTSRARRSSGIPARDFSSSAPLEGKKWQVGACVRQVFFFLLGRSTHRIFRSIAVSSAKR